ncbi:jg13181 [Pararge aegeria aegeria]|uniref:Integrin beta n=1 Tax=Pararge aegeria aegeria TaxID=348720 RepID=A0A8S4RBN8_9NEOP|nr:jg13181 [Pararge aegeria aegeria]
MGGTHSLKNGWTYWNGSPALCIKFKSCSECITSTDEICVWCSAKDHIGHRCHSESVVDWCKEPVYDPKGYVISVLSEPFNDGKEDARVVQLMPQEMKIKARINVPFKFDMYYKPAKDYPLDVYFLFDSSVTMKAYIDILQKQGTEIYEGLTNITNNVQLGVGSFIEKPSLPFVSIPTQTSHAFKNYLKLTNKTELFKKALLEVEIGSNNDIPEATLDALMQAMVCENHIGWRNGSHRIILVGTDANYHSAYDGKFVGAIIPHDMKCHLDNNIYDKDSLKFDYPSVSQINKIASDGKIMIIFTVPLPWKGDYVALTEKINNAKYVHLSEENEVVNMVINENQKLVSSVQIYATTEPSISLTFEPDCTLKDKCLYNHKPLQVIGTLILKSLPESGKSEYKVKIGPVSIAEKLTLHVEAITQCDCEKPDQGEKDSDLCSNAGTYQCGICLCNKNRYGDICNFTGTCVNDPEKCKANSNDPKPCSNRGICRCDKCECPVGFSGNFCEFDDNSCKRPGGMLCSGNGRCEFGMCQCNEGWSPDDCRCPISNISCIAPHSKELCSGQGDCVCGRCVCNSTNTGVYCVGLYCDECVESIPERCLELEDYAYCNLKNNKTVCDEKYNFTDTDAILVNKTAIYSDIYYMAKMWCRKILEDGQILVFRYHYPQSGTNSTLRLIIQDELDVTPADDVWVVVGSVIGAVLLIGILTLVAWKILVDLHDKREYEKFKKSTTHTDGQYDESSNPLYQSPAMSFSNPAYNCG